jgi:Tol biopolymer transport system component
MRYLAKLICALCLLGMAMPSALNAQPPRNTKIAFCFYGPMGFDLAITDGEGAPKILTTNHFSLFPYFSRDGQSIFFTQFWDSRSGKILQIFRFDLKSHRITRISDGSAIEEFPVVSPDGKRLAFCSRPASPEFKVNQYRIYLMDISGKNRKVMDLDDDGPQLYPTWSPNGDKIAYSHISMPFSSSLKVRDLTKQTTISLLPFYFYPMESSWSPTGDQIAFTSLNPLTGSHQIWLVKADGSDRQKLTDGPADQHPCWFPDGRHLAFTRKDGEAGGKEIRGLYVIDMQTRKITKLISMKGRIQFPTIALAPDQNKGAGLSLKTPQ